MSDAQATKKQNLAQKSPWITGLLTFFLPFAGYLYTRRFLLAVTTFILFLVFASMSDTDSSGGLLAMMMIIACLENIFAVSRARSAYIKETLHQEQQQDTSDLRVTLLKLAQQKGEVTAADCVIATHRDVDDIRSILSELERKDLIRAINREVDGAVAYRVV